MRVILRLYRKLNILSIDVVVGAIICALFFARILEVQVKTYGLIALGLTVWVIYTTDHLLDAKKIKHSASTRRHRFHQQHFGTLTFFLCAAIVLDCITILFVRRRVFEWGLILSSMVFVYLIGQRSLRFLKELFIASLYTCGVLLLSLTVTVVEITVSHYLLIVQFGLIAWCNLVLFSWFDHVFDQRDEQNSFVTMLGRGATLWFLYALFVSNFLLTATQILLSGFSAPILLLSIMNATLLIIFVFRNALAKNDRYRLIGDAIFLFPVFLLQ